ncbi:conserved Plasmodium protein, unknown function [Plasmodium knowlesi strain H]|uniref:Uncharacterized protein n=3 Tax=Plasmodium knowlesi TaxID=5850 RepID=A0A5K1U1T1_PLAKH|nr:conserved Plasmodium protein, unknown function [Plasmodium knowlesi strain H]OTN64497.1 Uncharacterized protein PKNOH_S130187600 [Plasmodium knowlesi]CAA9989039.1 conserved Plasmodium protein, unknown function [Plasmodium knowlesi strain H]SBO27249.1 conserved Plasmodium protein, unknown function [Plasmodium knowlesi strain H]SBO28880.1 conserved Plasmodium protein, unknown function [Plasmodium knowlesi strain H]VVS78513.1 conserved Plasmodium protein, unknown function [Plasmodium knowlesi |eukprot:XP_002261388.1 hypothetical protein, conserved in Plasmodium species [Plasmodium knowlesi strain H]
MISLKEHPVWCEKKKCAFLLSVVISKYNRTNGRSEWNANRSYSTRSNFLRKQKKKKKNLIKNERSLPLSSKTPSVLCEFNVEAEKKIYFHNLFNFPLVDVLTIFKLLLQLRKVTLYKYNDNISFTLREIKKGDISYKSTIRTYLLFLKKYLSRNKHGENEILELFRRLQFEKQTEKEIDVTASYDGTDSEYITSHDYSLEGPGAHPRWEVNKKKWTLMYILKKIIRKLNVDIRQKGCINNVRDKSFLFKFLVNKKKFRILSFYKKIKGVYYLCRNVMYVQVNSLLQKDIALLNLVSTNKSFLEIDKSKIALDPFYVKYYYKYHLNKLLCLSEQLFLMGRKLMHQGNLIHLSQMEMCTGRSKERAQGEFSFKDNISIWSHQTIENETDNKNSSRNDQMVRLKKDSINIKVINVYLNGKFSVALPLVLTYNINKDIFYLNNLFYLDGSKYDMGSILIRKEIYFNNLSFFQWKNFRYLNNENIILNSDNLRFDLNYVLLFYHLYFNEGEKLCIRSHINPTFYFYPPVRSRKGSNQKRVERVVYRADKNVLNFVF